jgi:hypothetical protein
MMKLLSRLRGTAIGSWLSCPFSTLVDVPLRRLVWMGVNQRGTSLFEFHE